MARSRFSSKDSRMTKEMRARTQRIDYGIDAPGVIRNLALIGLAALVAGSLTIYLGSSNWLWGFRFAFFSIAFFFIAESLLMIAYAKIGKFRHRDRILAAAGLRGHERVLDLGTGRGLLAVGAAKRLKEGRVVAVDIWKSDDLSSNSRDRTEAVIEGEGVSDRVEIREADVTTLPFDDESFDVVLSNLCIHNIPNPEGRRRAIEEAARVLKPGGRAVISDFKNTAAYANHFRDAGFDSIERSGPFLWDTFPPLRIVIAQKRLAAA